MNRTGTEYYSVTRVMMEQTELKQNHEKIDSDDRFDRVMPE